LLVGKRERQQRLDFWPLSTPVDVFGCRLTV